MGNRERGSRKKKQRPDKMKVNLLNKKELRGFCPYFTIRLFYSFMILLLFFEGFKGFFVDSGSSCPLDEVLDR